MSRPATPFIVFDDVVIDLAGQRLLRAGSEQPLEPKAFAVLALLLEGAGRVFTRDDILDAVWGHRHVTPGVLNRVMTLLRHALGEDARTPRYLHTVHGVGYRFDLPAMANAAGAAASPPLERVVAATVATDPPSGGYRRRANDRPAGKRPATALWLLPLLAVLVPAGWKLWPQVASSHRPAPPASVAPAPFTDRSIAVLPLVNASSDPAQQFFSDGLSENLISALARFDGLKVIGRTSSFQFRDSGEDSALIGRKLGVTYLLNGSVQHAGEVVRINTSLTRAADGSTLWAEHYDRPYQDLFALQDEIARAVASALQPKLLRTPGADHQDNRPPSGNFDAYNAYLQGLRDFYVDDYRGAVTRQQQATRIDPGYATAWAQLSTAWALIGQSAASRKQAQHAYAESRKAIDTALQLAPDLGIARGALGNLLLAADFDWRGSIAQFRRGVELAPEVGQVRGGLSRALAASGHLHEAIEQRQRFLVSEPLFAANHFLYAQLLTASGQLEAAEASIRWGNQLQPRKDTPYDLMYIAILRGDAKTALEVANAQSNPSWREMNRVVALQAGADRATADAALRQAIIRRTWERTSPYLLAQAYALRGDADSSVDWLERAWSMRDTNLHRTLYDPLILRLRKHPRLIAFCAKVGLPPPENSEALSLEQIRAANAVHR